MTAAAGLMAGEVVVLLRTRRRGWARSFADGVGQGNQIVGRGRRWGEIAVVADQFPASGGGEAAGVGFAEVVRVRLGECGKGSDHRRGIAVDVGQGGDRLSGTAVTGAAPWGPHGGTLSLSALSRGRCRPRHAER